MITSSKFFEKSFFTLENNDEIIHKDQLSPWGFVYHKPIQDQNNKSTNINPVIKSPQDNKVYEIPKISSLKYLQRKLKIKSQSNNTHELIPVQQPKKYHTIEYKQNPIQNNKTTFINTDSLQLVNKIKKRRKKYNILPQLTIHQYNQIKTKGNSIMIQNTNPIVDILERKKNRKKILQQFNRGTTIHKINIKNRQKSSNSKQSKSVLSGRYVYVAKNPQFTVNGLPTTRLLNQY